MVAIVWRKPGLTLDEFTARWRDVHSVLVNEHKAAMGFVRYVQSHSVASPEIDAFRTLRGWTSPPDGVAELWWESEAALKRAFESPEAAAASAILEEDERHFVDMERTAAFLSREFEVFNVV
jgi:uncharacterized protein (TIGR02118 family)